MAATLPTEWCDEKALEIWRNQDWYSIFGCQPLYKHEAEFHIEDVRQTIEIKVDPEVWLPPEWYDDAARYLWSSQHWEALFPTPTSENITDNKLEYQAQVYIKEVQRDLNDPVVHLTSAPWLDDWLQKWEQTGMSKADGQLLRNCPNCGNPETHRTLSKGEVARSTTCSSCYSWYVVDKDYPDP